MPLSTVLDLLTAALTGIRVHRLGAPLPPEMAEHALTQLNRLLAAWVVDGRTVYVWRELTLPLTGALTYTIGPAGVLDTTRPVAVHGGFTRLGGNDYPYDVIPVEVFNAIGFKAQGGTAPSVLYYEATYPLGVLHPFPVASGGVLHLFVDEPFSSVTLNATLSFPDGYADALTYALGRREASTYGQQLDPLYLDEARKAETGLRRRAHRPMYATVPMPGSHGPVDDQWIYTGGMG